MSSIRFGPDGEGSGVCRVGFISLAIEIAQGIERGRGADPLAVLVLDLDDRLAMRIDDQTHRLAGEFERHFEARP